MPRLQVAEVFQQAKAIRLTFFRVKLCRVQVFAPDHGAERRAALSLRPRPPRKILHLPVVAFIATPLQGLRVQGNVEGGLEAGPQLGRIPT